MKHASSYLSFNTDVPKQSVILVAIGTALEWYDFTIFAYMVPYLQQVFWGKDHVYSLIFSYGIFALAYFTRPIGGILFGIIGDKYGRKPSIILSSLMIALSMLLIAVLPSYAMVGYFAIILLVVMRLIQGISLGGEFTGTTVLLIEYGNNQRRRGFFASFANAFSSIGFFFSLLVVNILTSTLTTSQIIHFGWRIPYFIGFILGIVFLILRLRVQESQLYNKNILSLKQRLQQVLCYKGVVLKGFVLLVLYAFTYYGIIVFLPNYYTMHYAGDHVGWYINGLLFIYMGFNVLAGYLSDIFGRKPILGIFSLLCGIILIFYLVYYSNIWWIVALPFLLMAFIDTVSVMFVAELFPTNIRMTTQGLIYPLATIVGGFTPMILTAVQHKFSFVMVGWMLLIAFVGLFLVTLNLKETKDVFLK